MAKKLMSQDWSKMHLILNDILPACGGGGASTAAAAAAAAAACWSLTGTFAAPCSITRSGILTL